MLFDLKTSPAHHPNIYMAAALAEALGGIAVAVGFVLGRIVR